MKIKVSPVPSFVRSSIPVTSPEIYDSKTGMYHPSGIFSEQIFGPVRSYQCQCGRYSGKQYEGKVCEYCGVKVESNEARRKTYSRIDLPFSIPHPLVLHHLFSRKRKLRDRFFSGKIESIDEIIDILDSSDHNIGMINLMQERNQIYTKIVPVIPPNLRPMINKYKSDDINKYYISILKDISKHTLSYAEKHLMYTLTKYVYKLFRYTYERIPKKNGLIRQSLLGKETDFSARTAIVPDPTLPADTISVSKFILYELLRPQIINTLAFSNINPTYADSIIRESIQSFKDNEMIDSALSQILSLQDDGVWVGFNRQPTLHRNSLMGFKVIMNNDFVIKVNPMICTGYNLDFDGDQMAIYMPLTDVAIKDTKEKLAFTKNLLVSGSMSFDNIQQNVSYGIYKISKDKPGNDISLKFDTKEQFKLWIEQNIQKIPLNYNLTIQVKDKNTTLGRAVLSYLLNEEITYPVPRKALANFITKKLQQYYIEGKDFDIDSLQTLFTLGVLVSEDLTLTLDDFIFDDKTENLIANTKKEIIERFKKYPKSIKMNIKFTIESLSSLSNTVIKKLKNNMRLMYKSGAKGNKSQISQIYVAKGFVTDITNRTVDTPILSSLVEGVKPEEFVIMSKAARKGSADRSIRTAEPGELTRQLIFALNPIELSKDLHFCGSEKTLNVELTKSNFKSYMYRYIKTDQGPTLLTYDNIDKYIGQTINLYSPIFCKSEKICNICYGEYNKYLNSPYIGMIASQSLGERATQLIMRTFHTGGTAQVSDISYPEDLFYEDSEELIAKKDIIVVGNVQNEILQTMNTLAVHEIDSTNEYTLTLPVQTTMYKLFDGEYLLKKGQAFCKLPDSSKGIASAIEYVKSILESNKISTFNLNSLYKTLVDIFGSLGVLSIWIEILISQLLRDPRDLTKLWRIQPDRDMIEPTLIPASRVPFMRPLLALAFQDIRKSLNVITKYGDLDIHNLTILEKIFLSRF